MKLKRGQLVQSLVPLLITLGIIALILGLYLLLNREKLGDIANFFTNFGRG